ncbi:substrate-binding domain-containing protein [Algibacter sp.]|jgi:sulfonate transport system substrate-binding protein|uniref:substrate-binding domain-containing protein n=1 Tax=uncultured Algibacter sp. TaxID=298659 RepID=UPI00233DD4EC|nr:substrate-binding domain-containing protein [uncultured Algibacter sp.]MDB4402261.1 substrate-binding domain-containing protein [Algibacter sp.]MDC1197699.1 substrate-binding domain-containing protein [Algibacter sp.]
MKQVNIGGVPEHFNLAWYLTLKNGEYKEENINLRWHDYYGGTGAMCKALRNGDIDIAVILTEGIIKDIIDGNPSKIVQTFVQTPLVWGVHVANHSNYITVEDLKGTKAAISRYGSGSHLMAYINAENNDWNLEKDLDFEVIKNLDGAVEGLTEGNADYFLWEKFTTKPLVDNGTFRRIDNCPSPWPCFVIAVRENFIKSNKKDLKTILDIINNTTADFKDIPSIDKSIANRYEQQIEDVREWLNITEWSQELIDEKTIMNVQKELFALNIIPEIVDYNKLTQKL